MYSTFKLPLNGDCITAMSDVVHHACLQERGKCKSRDGTPLPGRYPHDRSTRLYARALTRAFAMLLGYSADSKPVNDMVQPAQRGDQVSSASRTKTIVVMSMDKRVPNRLRL